MKSYYYLPATSSLYCTRYSLLATRKLLLLALVRNSVFRASKLDWSYSYSSILERNIHAYCVFYPNFFISLFREYGIIRAYE